MIGLFAWAFVENWLRGGASQAVGWFGAKFFNEPYGGGQAAAGGKQSTNPASRPQGPARGGHKK